MFDSLDHNIVIEYPYYYGHDTYSFMQLEYKGQLSISSCGEFLCRSVVFALLKWTKLFQKCMKYQVRICFLKKGGTLELISLLDVCIPHDSVE